MPDLTYALMTLVAFALLALLAGRLDRRPDDDPAEPAGQSPAAEQPAGSTDEAAAR